MAKIKLVLDTRKGDDLHPVSVVIRHNNTTSYIYTDIRIPEENWCGSCVINSKRANVLNASLLSQVAAVEKIVDDMRLTGELRLAKAVDIKEKYLRSVGIEPTIKKTTFESRFIEFMERKKGGTYKVYRTTLNHLRAFDPKFPTLTFEQITRGWLVDFVNSLDIARNSSNIDLRNIRSVFNEAIDDEITTAYPFRKLKIKPEFTKDRSLSPEDLRKIFFTEWEPWQQEYADIFKLMFYLCGINAGDLFEMDTLRSGRAEYTRKKTGKHYSIKIEPEAMEIINKYKGKKHLLSMLDRYSHYTDYLHHMNDALKTLGLKYENGLAPKGEALFPELSSYYARYSWATTAALLDIPKETIAAALGHSQSDVTSIYIRTDYRRKVDEANRKVIDYILAK